MNVTITRDVISDLLPIYFAGEVSADTARMVEQYFVQDPEFAGRARTLAAATATHSAEPGPALERAALVRAKRFVRCRAMLFGVALAATLSPMMVAFNGNGVQWWMVRDNPIQAAVLLLAGTVCWILYAMLGYGRRRTGL